MQAEEFATASGSGFFGQQLASARLRRAPRSASGASANDYVAPLQHASPGAEDIASLGSCHPVPRALGLSGAVGRTALRQSSASSSDGADADTCGPATPPGGSPARARGAALAPVCSAKAVLPPQSFSSPARGGTPDAAPPARGANGLCDRCDGDHDTLSCPVYPKPREAHPDAARRTAGLALGADGGHLLLSSADARVVRQPGDGSCLYHSLVHGLRRLGGGVSPPAPGGLAATAEGLRAELADWVVSHPGALIADTPLSDWVAWDSGVGLSCAEYGAAQRAPRGRWGGGVEMAALARARGVSVHVWEGAAGGGFRRISRFDCEAEEGGRCGGGVVHVLYRGGVHFDALQLLRGGKGQP